MNLLDHALKYLEQGLPVFPVDSVSFIPKVKWKDYQIRLPEKSNLIYWWTMWPDAMIGLVTGKLSGLVCVDVDVKNGADYETNTKRFQTNSIVETSHSLGRHYYYNISDQHVPTRIGIEQGIDIKGEGGYTILPPSAKLGKQPYQWVLAGTPAEWPQVLQDWVINTEKEESADPFWVTDLLNNGAPEGKRNQLATKLAGYFASKNISSDILLSLITSWNNTTNTDLPQSEINSICKSVSDRERQRGNKNTQQSHTSDSFELVDFKSYIRSYGDATYNWTVRDWLPSKTIAFMVAAPESYKTWLLLDLAVSIASGLDFIGASKVEDKGPVIIVQQEDFHGQMAQRLATIIYNKVSRKQHNQISINPDGSVSIPNYDNLPIYLHPDRRLKFGDQSLMDQLEEQIEKIRPKAILIDPLYSTVDTDDYMTSAVKDMWRLKEMRDKYGCTFVLAHHTRKNSSGGTQREDSWGSQFLNAFLETGWQLRQTDTKGIITVRRHFKTFQGSSEIFLKFNINTESPPFDYEITEVTEGSVDISQNSIINHLMKTELTAEELAKRLNCTEKSVLPVLNKLLPDKIIGKKKNGKYFLFNRSKE